MTMGIMSYRSWPLWLQEEEDTDSRIAQTTERRMQEIIKNFAGWLHTVRDPSAYLGDKVPRMRYAESDMQFPMTMNYFKWSNRMLLKKNYDLVYVNVGDGEWHNACKNWTLATNSFRRLIDELDLKILIIGRSPPAEMDANIDWIE